MLEVNLSAEGNVEQLYQQILKEYLAKETELFTYIVSSVIDKPIKGEITAKKLKNRGISVVQKITGQGYERWLEQRGVRISPILEFNFHIMNDNIQYLN